MVRRGSKVAIAAAFLAVTSTISAAVELGIDVLEQNNCALLLGKRVGLVTNQTSIDSRGNKTRALLHEHCNLVALYTPEHGLSGTEKAGRYVKSRKDSLTGLPAYSLYGPTRKPTPAMMRSIDVLVFDIQDIGCRSYWVNAPDFTRYLRSLDLSGVIFTEFDHGHVHGSSMRISPSASTNLTGLGIYMLVELNRASGSNLFGRSNHSKLDIFFKCYGSASIRSQLERGLPAARIVASWQSDVASFRAARAPYVIY